MSAPDGGPAFPTLHRDGQTGFTFTTGGQSLRAYYAGQALLALVRREPWELKQKVPDAANFAANFAATEPKVVANLCVAYADALIAELAKEI